MTEIEKHRRILRDYGCLISRRRDNIELHHCHGGSLRGVVSRGTGFKSSDWLVIPLHHDLHTGDFNPEAIGIDTWEVKFKSQVELLNLVCEITGTNVWKKAGIV